MQSEDTLPSVVPVKSDGNGVSKDVYVTEDAFDKLAEKIHNHMVEDMETHERVASNTEQINTLNEVVFVGTENMPSIPTMLGGVNEAIKAINKRLDHGFYTMLATGLIGFSACVLMIYLYSVVSSLQSSVDILLRHM